MTVLEPDEHLEAAYESAQGADVDTDGWEDDEPEPDEVCPRGCERFGDWWSVPVDCPVHLL